MMNISEYEDLAKETGVYKDIELEILKETLASWREKPGEPNTLLELRDGKILAGFAILCRDEGTEYSFELRAMCVDPSYLDKGIAEKLVDMLEAEALRQERSAILSVETSGKKAAAAGAGLFPSKDYSLIGHIPDFYSPGDDYYMYARHLSREAVNPKEKGKEEK